MLGVAISAPVIGVDAFMKDRTMTAYSLWECFDYGRLEREVLLPFSQSENPLHYGVWDWYPNTVTKTVEVPHAECIITEGVGLFRPELLHYFAYAIWIDCPLDEATERGKERDREVHKNPQDKEWDGIWKQNDAEYFEKFKPKEIADVVIDNA